MIAQISLPLASRKNNHADDLQRLEDRLSWADDWILRKQLSYELGMDDRHIRKLAELSDGRIIGTDQGYKIIERVTKEEFEEWKGRYWSQIKKMVARFIRTCRAWYARRGA